MLVHEMFMRLARDISKGPKDSQREIYEISDMSNHEQILLLSRHNLNSVCSRPDHWEGCLVVYPWQQGYMI